MSGVHVWTDLLDPDAEALRQTGLELHPRALEQLLAAPRHDDDPRPTLVGHGNYIFGVFLVAVSVPEEDRVYYQEIDLILTKDRVLTVRKTPPNGKAYDPAQAQDACRVDAAPGMVAFHLVDDVAERYLDLIDVVNDEIEELEDHADDWTGEKVRERISALRHDMLHIRRTLAPTRDAVRGIVDNRIELDGPEVFPHDVEIQFGAAYDKLQRATEGLEFSRDLLQGVRDYHQAKVANDQNEVTKRLTVIASLVLIPTFVVGVYGQNFDHMPELHWHYGYLVWSWGIIVVTTIAQLALFRWKKWI
jgi:magnesium transporter